MTVGGGDTLSPVSQLSAKNPISETFSPVGETIMKPSKKPEVHSVSISRTSRNNRAYKYGTQPSRAIVEIKKKSTLQKKTQRNAKRKASIHVQQIPVRDASNR